MLDERFFVDFVPSSWPPKYFASHNPWTLAVVSPRIGGRVSWRYRTVVLEVDEYLEGRVSACPISW